MIICLIIINFKSPKNPIVNTHKNVRIRQKHRHHLASKIYHYYSRRRNSISISPFQSARNGTTIIQDLVFFHLLIIICKGGGEKKSLDTHSDNFGIVTTAVKGWVYSLLSVRMLKHHSWCKEHRWLVRSHNRGWG